MEPEKSSPVLPAGVKPFQPRRKDMMSMNIKEEIANVEDVGEATLDPST